MHVSVAPLASDELVRVVLVPDNRAVSGVLRRIWLNVYGPAYLWWVGLAGHAEMTGDYHYHFPPSCLLAAIGDMASGHSPHIGWAYDGTMRLNVKAISQVPLLRRILVRSVPQGVLC